MDFSEIEAQIDKALETHGWFVMAVSGGSDGSTPPFAYSIGFTESLGLPEVVMTGFSYEMCHGVIGTLFDGLKDGRLKFPEEEAKLQDVISNDYDVLLRPIPFEVSSNMTTWAFARPTNTLMKAWHMLMPDPQNLFPGDPGCDPRYEEMQNILAFAENDNGLRPI